MNKLPKIIIALLMLNLFTSIIFVQNLNAQVEEEIIPTDQPTPVPTAEPTSDPTPSPEPTIEPTATPAPTVAPTVQPTIAPTPEPTFDPTPSPSPSPTHTPTPTTEPTSTPLPTLANNPTPSPTSTTATTNESGNNSGANSTSSTSPTPTPAPIIEQVGSTIQTAANKISNPQNFLDAAYYSIIQAPTMSEPNSSYVQSYYENQRLSPLTTRRYMYIGFSIIIIGIFIYFMPLAPLRQIHLPINRYLVKLKNSFSRIRP